jgi:hypothetical protein
MMVSIIIIKEERKMALTDRSQAKESGFAQVREALLSFEGDVDSAEFGQWGGTLIDDEGKPLPKKEFFEISCSNVNVLEVSEELSMPIEEWNFRVNCSDYVGSFWVEKFLASADEQKVQIPDGLVNKRVTFKKETLKAFDRAGNPTPKFDSTNYIIAGVREKDSGGAVSAPVQEQTDAPAQAPTEDPMEALLDIAIDKTETQFRTAVGLDPRFAGSPLLSLAKTGAITQSLVNDGKLALVKSGNKEVYKRPE